MHKNSEVTLLQLNKSIEAVKLVQKAADLCRCIYQSVFICGCCTGYAGCRAVQCAGIYAGFGNNFAVAILPLMYALVFSLLLLPVSAVLQRKKIEYIQK